MLFLSKISSENNTAFWIRLAYSILLVMLLFLFLISFCCSADMSSALTNSFNLLLYRFITNFLQSGNSSNHLNDFSFGTKAILVLVFEIPIAGNLYFLNVLSIEIIQLSPGFIL